MSRKYQTSPDLVVIWNAVYFTFFLRNEPGEWTGAGSGVVTVIATLRWASCGPGTGPQDAQRKVAIIVTSSGAQSPPIICHAPTASRREATRSYPTRWRPRLGENGKCWISKFSLNDITQILLHIKDYNIWNSFSLTDMRLLPLK